MSDDASSARVAVRRALGMPMLSDRKCDAVVTAVLGAIVYPGQDAEAAGIRAEGYRSLGQKKVRMIWIAMIDALRFPLMPEEERQQVCRDCWGQGGYNDRGGPGACERCGRVGVRAEESGSNINQTPHVAGEGLMDTINRLPNAAQADPAFWDPIMSRMRYGASTPSAPQPPSPILPDAEGKA